jgi:hypothetical protein
VTSTTVIDKRRGADLWRERGAASTATCMPLRAIMTHGRRPHRFSHAQPGHAHGRAHRLHATWTSCWAGMQKSDLIILAARPAMGKTSAGAQRRAQRRQTLSVRASAVFSLEMSGDQLGAASAVDGDRHRQPPPAVGSGLTRRSGRSCSLRPTCWPTPAVFIDDTPAAAVNEIRTKCRRLYCRAWA